MRIRPRSLQAGVGLVELLVAVVIAAIGLLSLAGLQAYSLRYTKLSQYRVIATQLAFDITERLRANRTTTADTASYEFTESFADQLASKAPDLSRAATCNTANDTCNVTAMAAEDLAQWRATVRRLLPEGAVYLDADTLPAVVTAGSATGLNLWIAWSDPSQVTGGDRPAGECPSGLTLDERPQVRCLFFRVQP